MTAAELLGIEGIEDIQALDFEGSSIYRARQFRHNRVVVIKIVDRSKEPLLPVSRLDIRRAALRRFATNDGVVTPYDHGVTAAGQRYLIMPYFRMGSLADQLSHGPMPWHRAAELVRRTAGIVAGAHDVGFVLGDLKPSRVLLADASSPLIAVFGMATRGFDDGAPSYRAPEAGRGGRPAATDDVYSLALILAALIAGRPPNRGPLSPEFMTDVVSPAPERIVEIIERGVAESPASRYPNAGHLGLALGRAIGSDEPTLISSPDPDAGEGPIDLEVLLGAQPPPPLVPPAPAVPTPDPEPHGADAHDPHPPDPDEVDSEPLDADEHDLEPLGADTHDRDPVDTDPHEPEPQDSDAPEVGAHDPEPLDVDQHDPERLSADQHDPEPLDLDQHDPAPLSADQHDPEALDVDGLDSDAVGAGLEAGHSDRLASGGGSLTEDANGDRVVELADAETGSIGSTRSSPPDQSGAFLETSEATSQLVIDIAPAAVLQPDADTEDRLRPPPAQLHPDPGSQPPAGGLDTEADHGTHTDPDPRLQPPPALPHHDREPDTPHLDLDADHEPGNRLDLDLDADHDPYTPHLDLDADHDHEPGNRLDLDADHDPDPGNRLDDGAPAEAVGARRWGGEQRQRPLLLGSERSTARLLDDGSTPPAPVPGNLVLARGPEAGGSTPVRSITADEEPPFRAFDRQPSSTVPASPLLRLVDPLQAGWDQLQRSLGSVLAVAGFAVVAGLVGTLAVRDLRGPSPGSSTGSTFSTVQEEGSPSTSPPTSNPPVFLEPPATHQRSPSAAPAGPSTVTSAPAPAAPRAAAPPTAAPATAASTTAAPTTIPPTSPPPTTAAPTTIRQVRPPTTAAPTNPPTPAPSTSKPSTTADGDPPIGPTVPLIEDASVSRVRATTARVQFTSSSCVTASFSYNHSGGRTTTVSGGSRCATSFTLLLGTVTPRLTSGTTYTVTIRATDGSGATSTQQLSFTTLG